MKGFSKKFLIMGGGLFIILLIVYTVIRKIEEFKLPTQRLPLNNKASSLLSSRSTPLLKPQSKKCDPSVTVNNPSCDSESWWSFNGFCTPIWQIVSEDGKSCGKSPYFQGCKNAGSSLCYNNTCTPISKLSNIPGFKNLDGYIYIPQNPSTKCTEFGTRCPNQGVCLEGTETCYDLYIPNQNR
jgi:hypothetical protein